MKKLWWRFYTWKVEPLRGTVFYGFGGRAVKLYLKDGAVYTRLPFANIWWRE